MAKVLEVNQWEIIGPGPLHSLWISFVHNFALTWLSLPWITNYFCICTRERIMSTVNKCTHYSISKMECIYHIKIYLDTMDLRILVLLFLFSYLENYEFSYCLINFDSNDRTSLRWWIQHSPCSFKKMKMKTSQQGGLWVTSLIILKFPFPYV